MINTNRRNFLKGTAATGVIVIAAGSGLLQPSTVWAADWAKPAFESNSIDAALKALYGTSKTTTSKKLEITANQQAENGAMVPVQIHASMKVDAVSVFVKENAAPLVANVKITGAAGFFRANIKMLKTSDVQFVVKSGNKLYTAKQKIKVTAGGCGG